MSDDKVKPIRKGIKIDNEPVKKQPIPSIQEKLQFLLELADSGDLRELTFIGITDENEIYSEYVGVMPEWPHNMYAELNHMTDMYYSTVFLMSCYGLNEEIE